MSSGKEPEKLRNSSWALGDWTVHPGSHEIVHASGTRVRLEARAMQVLQYLHDSAGEVVSTEQMLARVWERKVVTPHSVATVISELRKALGPEGRSIETIPKRGYRLMQPVASNEIPAATPGVPAQAPGPARRLRAWSAGGVAVALVVAVTLLFWFTRGDSHGGGASRSVDSSVTAQYLRARQLWSRREHDATLQAREILVDLVARNEDHAPAHAALADIYAHKTGEDLGLPELETFREAQRLLDRATALDPDLAEAFVTQALLDVYRDHQPEKALRTVSVALEKDPDFAYAWQTRAMLLSAVGEHEQSLAAIRRARALDQVSASIGWDEVWFLYLAGEQDQARDAFDRESRHSAPNNLYGALIEQARGHVPAAFDFWLQRLRVRGAQLPDPAAIEALARRGPASDAYREMLRQVRSLPRYQESAVVLAAWLRLSGDDRAAQATLAATPPDRRNWLALWVEQMPVFEVSANRG
ncbi:MAG TPA: winged helix-turn-helix domain-containing protein [Steroidobacteraceae bacterium]|nr:winged helix-turn-helix domain-containing protein [Steroidobacteraceae bacterium]